MAVRHQDRHRILLAQEAARIMADEGVRDFRLAKRKAAERLGLPVNGTLMPRNTEIEQALIDHQRLFNGAFEFLIGQFQDVPHLGQNFHLRVAQALVGGRPHEHCL